METKGTWSTPRAEIQQFAADEYVAACWSAEHRNMNAALLPFDDKNNNRQKEANEDTLPRCSDSGKLIVQTEGTQAPQASIIPYYNRNSPATVVTAWTYYQDGKYHPLNSQTFTRDTANHS